MNIFKTYCQTALLRSHQLYTLASESLKVSASLTCASTLVVLNFLIFANLLGRKVIFLKKNCITLIIRDVEHFLISFFMFLLLLQ